MECRLVKSFDINKSPPFIPPQGGKPKTSPIEGRLRGVTKQEKRDIRILN